MTSASAGASAFRLLVEPAANRSDGVEAVVPELGGHRLTDLVAEYEASQGFDVVGGYGGIIPAFFNYGPLDRYFLGGRDDDYWGQVGKIAVLGCDCGEVGCWPLYVAVEPGAGRVTWSGFEQPHRRERDYSSFGPFVFTRADYEAAISAVISTLAKA